MKTSQQTKFLNLLDDNKWHCSSELYAMYIADPRTRICELKKEGYNLESRSSKGWMIQAIENNYEAPSTYFEERKQQTEQQAIAATRIAIQDCHLCDNTGFRYIKSSKYPNGAMRRCSHDTIEAQYTDSLKSAKPIADDAVQDSIRGEKPEHDKRPAEDPASP